MCATLELIPNRGCRPGMWDGEGTGGDDDGGRVVLDAGISTVVGARRVARRRGGQRRCAATLLVHIAFMLTTMNSTDCLHYIF
jgi:hypothetical protein